jgi:hypothetical protein
VALEAEIKLRDICRCVNARALEDEILVLLLDDRYRPMVVELLERVVNIAIGFSDSPCTIAFF